MNTAGKPGSDSDVQANNDKVDTVLNLNSHVPFCVACSVVPNVSLTHSWARESSEWNPSHQYNFNSNDFRLTMQQSGLTGPCDLTCDMGHSSQQQSYRPALSQYYPVIPFLSDYRQPSYDELFLPRPELKNFNGNPLEYKSFISNFETHVEPRVRNSKMLFCLLLQHCGDKIKESIEHFSEKGDLAYALAKSKLQCDFGRPCIIADI